jgi:hypothetical protein
MTYLYILFISMWLAGHLLPWYQMKSKGLEFSARIFFSRIVRKSVFATTHNGKIFDTLRLIRDHRLDISFEEIEQLYLSNVDLQKFTASLLLIKNRGINISKEALRNLTYSNKDLVAIINTKKPGEEIQFADAFGDRQSQAVKHTAEGCGC